MSALLFRVCTGTTLALAPVALPPLAPTDSGTPLPFLAGATAAILIGAFPALISRRRSR